MFIVHVHQLKQNYITPLHASHATYQSVAIFQVVFVKLTCKYISWNLRCMCCVDVKCANTYTAQAVINQTALSYLMMTSSNGNIFRDIGHLCWEFTCHRWIPRTNASDAEL